MPDQKPSMISPTQPLQSTTNALGVSSQPPLRTSSYVERKLGDTELSYFLPSRESGVNDMYVHSRSRIHRPKSSAGISISDFVRRAISLSKVVYRLFGRLCA